MLTSLLEVGRTLYSWPQLGDAATANKLIKTAEQYKERAGGYTRLTRLGQVGKRVGESARIEFVK